MTEISLLFPNIKQPSITIVVHSPGFVRQSILNCDAAIANLNDVDFIERNKLSPSDVNDLKVQLNRIKNQWTSIPPVNINRPEEKILLDFKKHNDSFNVAPCSHANIPANISQEEIEASIEELDNLLNRIEQASAAWLSLPGSVTYKEQKLPHYANWTRQALARKAKYQARYKQ